MRELNDAVIEEHAKTLKLPALRRELDRLGHHAHIITTKGLSYRTAARRRGAGREPEKTAT